jgi:hypothetical protein
MGAILIMLGLAGMTAGAVLLMPYTYAWMERLGWLRRWLYGIALVAFGVALVAGGQAIN